MAKGESSYRYWNRLINTASGQKNRSKSKVPKQKRKGHRK
nr:MAG TPA: hypothetical protein [Caudoviricetes sp.]